jgi:hypothetical protein
LENTLAVIKVGATYYNTVTGRKITNDADLLAEIERAGQVGIPTRNNTAIVGGSIASKARTPARAAHKAAGISGGFIGHAEAPKATDGQSLASQGADVIATYTSVHGDNAYSQWVKDHNRETGAGPVRVPAPGSTSRLAGQFGDIHYSDAPIPSGYRLTGSEQDPRSKVIYEVYRGPNGDLFRRAVPGPSGDASVATDPDARARRLAAIDVTETPDDEMLSPGGLPGETIFDEKRRLEAALKASKVDTTGMTLTQLRTEILERGIIARALTETEKEEAGEKESIKTGIPDLDTALEGLRITTGFKERELDAKIAADAAQAAYLEKRLNFESEDASRAAALSAARLVIEERSLNRQYGLDVGNFLMSARGPRNFGQLFNIYGGDPAKAGGLPGRILSAVGGGGAPVGATPNTAVPAGAQLGFDQVIRNLYAGGAQPTADQVMGALMGSTPEPTVPGATGEQAGVPVPQPAFGASASNPRPGFTLDPRNVNPQQFNKLLPSEQTAAFSLFESGGFPIEDVAEIFNRALPNAQRLASARLGTSGLRV